jgi:hypothetical protein
MTTNGALKGYLIAAWAIALVAHSAQAAVTAEEAMQLGTALTEFGAEKSGNGDGSIPAYTGGIEGVAGYDRNTATHYADPFKDEKPLYSITAGNLAQYDAVLSPGTKVLLKTYPEYRIDVYPSHRSVRYTRPVLQNTIKNSTTAKTAGAVEGDAIVGVDGGNLPYAGIPFPIPKTGYEVMWNHNLHFSAAVNHFSGVAILIDSAGNQSEPNRGNVYLLHPWYDTKGTLRSQTFDSIFGLTIAIVAPPRASGGGYLGYYFADMASGQKAWFYVPGQRRIRPAPDTAYDMSLDGPTYWDEMSGFLGRMDRFDFKLVGKKEMLIPYNVFGITNTVPTKDFLGKKFVNPNAVRWEKHRVWVIESTRKPGASHVYARRTFYVDEDCWCVTQTDSYDNAGNLSRVNHVNSFPSYSTGGINVDSWTTYDLEKGFYYVHHAGYADGDGRVIRDYETAEGLPLRLTPQSFVGGGVQ